MNKAKLLAKLKEKRLKAKAVEEEPEIIEEDVEDTRSVLYIPHKKRCLKCNYLLPAWKQNIYPCNEDPSCPARIVVLKKGEDPVVLVQQVAEALSASEDKPKRYKRAQKFLKKIMKRKDGMRLLKQAQELIKQRETDEAAVLSAKVAEAAAETMGGTKEPSL
jgi:hypothetical protein